MRDRLIELLKEIYPKTRYIPMEECREKIADYLIENGVIVPPCKVGDKAYVISRYYGGELKIFECKINDITIFESNMFIALHSVNNFCFAENAEQICKTVFLTREDAENALKGSVNNA